MRKTKSIVLPIENLESRTLLSAAPRVVGYLPDYRYSQTLLQNLDWSGLTQVNYFSVRPTSAGVVPSTSSSGYDISSQLDPLVQAAHAHNVKVDVVVGGAGLDDTLTQIIDDGSDLWKTFADNMQTFCDNHSVDGIDLDWEPDSPSSSQITNYGGLIASLKNNTSGLALSAAVNAEQVYLSGGGRSFVLNSQGISNLDAINVMAYDLRPGSQFSPVGQTEQDLADWGTYVQANGGAKSQLDFAMPFYGRDGSGTADTYADILQSYIDANGSAPSTSADTLTIGSTTWYLNSPATITNKTNYALDNGYGGVATWELGQDYFTASGYDSTLSLFPQIHKAVSAHSGPVNTASISGKVFNDANSSGTLDGSETGIAGATVYNDANNNSTLDSGELSAMTNSAGVYTFSGLAAGSYKIRAVVPAGATQTTPASNGAWSVSLAKGQAVTGDNFGQHTNGVVTGGKVSGAVKNGSTGITGVTVYLDANGNSKLDASELSVTTTAGGAYAFSNVPAGAYVIRQVLPAGYKQVTPSLGYGIHVSVAKGQTLTNENFADSAIAATGGISGTVFNDKNGNGAKNTGETGLSGWTVFLDTNGDGVLNNGEKSTSTDSSGNFSFTGLSAASYVVRAVRRTGYNQTTPTKNYGQHVTLTSGQKTTGVLFGERKTS